MWRYHCLLLFWSYAVVLTERTVWINYFLHLMRVLFLCLIIISHLIFSMYIINMKSHDFSCAIWNKQALVNFFKDHKLLVFKKISSCLFIPNCTKIIWLPIQIEPLLSEVQVLFCFVLFFFRKDLKSLHGKDWVRYLTDISTVFNNFFP